MATILACGRVTEARVLAEVLLSGLDERWQHTVGVARRAEELSGTVDPVERDVLVQAAWLHDVGYSPALRETGSHALDGANYLDRHGWPRRVSSLVAHHSGARFVARAEGLLAVLGRYPCERSPVADALTYADQTVGPWGQRLSIEERMAEVLARHGADSAQAKVRTVRESYLRSVAVRVRHRLSQLAEPRVGG